MEESNTTSKDVQVMPMGELAVADVKKQVQKIQELMGELMQEGLHYGTLPGADKPSLFKAGAEKLDFTFRLIPKFEIAEKDLPNNHREYRFICDLYHFATGKHAGQGVGSCSTMESQYRYRADYEIQDAPIPEDAKEKKAEYRKQGYGMKKINDSWCWVKYNEQKQENPDIADVYNSVLKKAKKRSLVDATITACAASDIFNQDIEDFAEETEPRHAKKSAGKPRNNDNPKQRAELVRNAFDFSKQSPAKLKFVNAEIAKIKTDKDADNIITIIECWKLPKLTADELKITEELIPDEVSW